MVASRDEWMEKGKAFFHTKRSQVTPWAVLGACTQFAKDYPHTFFPKDMIEPDALADVDAVGQELYTDLLCMWADNRLPEFVEELRAFVDGPGLKEETDSRWG